jgi:tetratricopeptide (TPR) repeat protein
MTVDFDKLRDLFHAAVEHPPEQRDAYLDQACAGDEELRRQAALLLKAHAQDRGLLDQEAFDADSTGPYQALTERPGTAIGPYKLLEQIGEGGFGVVFMAEQQEPIRRKVALKVLKPGMDTRQVIARFEAERQALALMDHPHIAKVHDAGQTDGGRPYFVMELVKGVPITDFCDQGRLTPRERLGLFVDVCQAVQHAHQKGIIHRDLKPSNVLVTLQDGTPLVKVIDFGIAKALSQQLTDKTLFTGFAQMLGTPLYMAPEQAALSNIDVDTRSDVYSLGVLLYELLTGTTPFDKERLHQASYDEMRRIIREEEPPRPSTRLSTLGQAASTASANRQSDPKRLSQALRGELDWVVMKALEKDRSRRYESASALAADVRRYLADEPVQARPASAWYRGRKFVRRNRAALAVAALLLAVAVLGGGAAAWSRYEWSARRAETGRAVAAALTQAETLLKEGDKQTEQPERWRATARLAQSAVERAEELLAAGVGTSELAAEVGRVRSAAAAAAADSGLLVEVERIRLEQAAVKDGHFDGTRLAPRYAELLRGYGVDPAEPEEAAARVRDSRVRAALVAALEHWWWATDDAAEARRLDEVLRAAEAGAAPFRERWRAAARRRDGPALARLARELAPERLPASDLVMLARALSDAKEWAAAERLLRAGQERFLGDFWLNHDLGVVLRNQGPARAEEAARYLTAALALRSDSPGVFLNLGNALMDKGDVEGAVRCYQAALRIDPNYAAARVSLGNALKDKGDMEGAVREYRLALDLDPKLARAHAAWGIVLQAKGDVEGAVHKYRLALDLDPKLAPAHAAWGTVLQAKGDVEGAIREYRLALDLDPKLAPAHLNLGSALQDKGDAEGAVREYRLALDLDPKLAGAHNNLGVALSAKGDAEGAVREFRLAIGLDPKLASAHNNLGLALRARGDVEGAVREYRLALDLDPKFARAHNNLGNALKDQGDVEGAIREFRQALDLDPKLAPAHYNLGDALWMKGDVDGAVREYRQALDLDPKFAPAHYDLGNALKVRGDVEGAIRCYQAALRIDPGLAQAHCNLGLLLKQQGQFAEAVRALKAGHKLGSRKADWRYPSAAWVREAERLAALDGKLAKVLKGEAQPADAAEQATLAWLCERPTRQLHAAATRFYTAAFASDPRLADNLMQSYRYDAARAAALAGCGLGKDDPPPDAAAKAKLRRQALDWLRADLAAYVKLLAGTDPKAPALVRQRLQHWQKEAVLRGVRDPDALAKLPEAERQPWRDLWDDVAATLARAQARIPPEKKSDAK